jgi:hypothetical protein
VQLACFTGLALEITDDCRVNHVDAGDASNNRVQAAPQPTFLTPLALI